MFIKAAFDIKNTENNSNIVKYYKFSILIYFITVMQTWIFISH